MTMGCPAPPVVGLPNPSGPAARAVPAVVRSSRASSAYLGESTGAPRAHTPTVYANAGGVWVRAAGAIARAGIGPDGPVLAAGCGQHSARLVARASGWRAEIIPAADRV